VYYIRFINVHSDWSYECTLNTVNVFEIGIALPVRSEGNLAATTPCRLQLCAMLWSSAGLLCGHCCKCWALLPSLPSSLMLCLHFSVLSPLFLIPYFFLPSAVHVNVCVCFCFWSPQLFICICFLPFFLHFSSSICSLLLFPAFPYLCLCLQFLTLSLLAPVHSSNHER